MSAAGGTTYQVGNFIIDTARYRILSGDAPVPVEPKVFDLLVHLIRHRDRVLTREELFEAIWDGREVSDATLSNHIKNARRALDDNGELQQTIETVRGRGYRFIAAVVELPATPGDALRQPPSPPPPPPLPPAGPSTGEPPPARRSSSRVWLLGALALVIVAVAIGWQFLSAPARPATTGRPYILVVPFSVSDNATADHRIFADQLTREVIDNLRKISGLRTVPQASAFQFRDDKTREHITASVPDVEYVLDGAVSVAPDGTLRITPRLADLSQDLDVWNSAFTVRVDHRNFFEAPAEIAKAVAAALKVQIVRDEQRALAELPRVPEANGPYAAGWRDMELFTHESTKRAVAAFDRAIALDPDFLAAYRAKSDALRTIFTYFESPQQMLPAVEASLGEVLQRDPDSAEALSALGLTRVMAWQWRQAWETLSRARALDPTLAQTELGFALYYCALGEREKVKESVTRAIELDPLNTELADWGNWALFMVGEEDAAREWSELQMRQHPMNGFVFSGAGIAAYLRGDTEKALPLLEKGVELSERAPVALIMLAQGHGYAGQTEKVLPLLEEAERANIYMCPYETAVAYLSLGDDASKLKALELLDQAIGFRSNCLIFLRNDPRMRILRDDPRHAARFGELLVRVGLDDAAVRAYRK